MANRKKPSAVKIKQGTLEKSREPENPVVAPLVTTMKVTKAQLVNAYAHKEFDRTVKCLSEMGILYEVSQSILLMYCNSVGIYFSAMDKVRRGTYLTKSKSNGMIVSPHIKVANEAMDRAIKIGSKFGMTPADMDKLESKEPPEEGDWVNV